MRPARTILLAGLLCALVGCAGNKHQGFARAASTGIALIQQAAADAEWETQDLLKDELHPLKKAKLTSISRSHSSIQSAAKAADENVRTSRAEYWSMKNKLDRETDRNKWFGWRTRQLFWLILGLSVAAWALAGGTAVVLGMMGQWAWSARLVRLIPLGNVFSMIRKRLTGVDMTDAAADRDREVTAKRRLRPR